jgi:hypothetical protein
MSSVREDQGMNLLQPENVELFLRLAFSDVKLSLVHLLPYFLHKFFPA